MVFKRRRFSRKTINRFKRPRKAYGSRGRASAYRSKKRYGRAMLGRGVGKRGGGIHTFVRKIDISRNAQTVTLINVDGAFAKGSEAVFAALTIPAATAANDIVYGSAAVFMQLKGLPGYTEFTTLFEQYRIKKVKVSFIPLATNGDYCQTTALWGTADGASGTAHAAPGLLAWSDIDFTDNIAPEVTADGDAAASIDTLREKASCVLHKYPAVISRQWTPRTQAPISYDGTAGNVAVAHEIAAPWIDTAVDSATVINHLGMKVIFAASVPKNSASTIKIPFQIEGSVVVECRYPK